MAKSVFNRATVAQLAAQHVQRRSVVIHAKLTTGTHRSTQPHGAAAKGVHRAIDPVAYQIAAIVHKQGYY